MKIHSTGQRVKTGIYFSPSPLDIHIVDVDGTGLDGREGGQYRRLPAPLALALAPVAGGLFVMAFPVLVLAAIAVAATQWAREKLRAFADEHAYVVQMRWQPEAAYLRHQREDASGEGGADDKEPDDEALELEAEAMKTAEQTREDAS